MLNQMAVHVLLKLINLNPLIKQKRDDNKAMCFEYRY